MTVTNIRHGRDAPNPSRRQAKVLTVSDSVVAGTRDDTAGLAVADRLSAAGFDIVETATCSDGVEPVSEALRRMCHGFHGVVVTTGGTGFGPRDLTPEATRSVIAREAPGMGEAMRNASPQPHGMLSRAVCGSLDQALVVNVPGSKSGALECLEAVLEAFPHALDLLGGRTDH